MARKGTIKYAENNLTPEQYAAWLAMPVKLSKKQLIAGELPPEGDPSADAPREKKPSRKAEEKDDEEEYDLVGGITLAAANHGAGGADDGIGVAEVVDLQAALIAFWECMDKSSKERAFEHQVIIDLLEDEPEVPEGEEGEGDEDESETE